MEKRLPRFAAALLAALALVVTAQGQAAPRILSQADIDRFIKDFPGIARDLDEAGANFDREVAKSQENPRTFTPAALRSLMRAAASDAGTREILDRYSWNDRFWDVYYVVFIGVYVSMMDQALVQYPSPELKAQVDAFREAIYRDDHTLVLRNLEPLVSAFEAAAGR